MEREGFSHGDTRLQALVSGAACCLRLPQKRPTGLTKKTPHLFYSEDVNNIKHARKMAF